MAQSCLEIRSMEERHREIARSDYQANNQYSAQHDDALATGDDKGKGTGHGGHLHSLPDCNAQPNIISYSNFDTAVSSGAGNKADNEARAQSLARSLYTPDNAYSEQSVDTTANVNEGQYVVG